MLHQWSLLVVTLLRTGLVGGCLCPPATILSALPTEVPVTVCCLNFSGSTLDQVQWSRLTNQTGLQILDLSHCNITSVKLAGVGASLLEKVYLGHNGIAVLPQNFLAGQPRLEEVDLSRNRLKKLPEGFLQDSDNLKRLFLQDNQLRFLPASVLQRPALQSLELAGNPWDCSCSFLDVLRENKDTKTEGLTRNWTCVSPWKLSGRAVWSVNFSDVCRPTSLTALFIALPLLILSTLVVCWCCGRKRKEAPMLGASKKRTCRFHGTGAKGPRKMPAPESAEKKSIDSVKVPKLLGDEEKEVQKGSVESLPPGFGSPEAKPSKSEFDSVSVTEVLKDSTAREKAYMTQSTEYYSLVPGIQLDDSDHGEYDKVDI
ncbi:leucine-rich repeat-containing protein 38 isoform X5 [Nerophis ophidion]|uniref:leucine-rich repeat-containing protein 38 isoform X5 n=1 Tax=Nerophis ophidion TaxID=159077 RepID=UPI002AE05ACB|nr:leucine-rich repeat-containing protein 38 isoform X5 [Nerophis ophidion]XP_061775661.1 leucine-rich repeat-containing protein 38 isoform X5 [Nerophis ophidion]XP_061775662.1 leucine-rich repeat-containing protein 38 isoform X5 [Nerophis ophidion]XP_061775663.1 leucine-rich repeat-containing protein 38 isoform X5 [Nerophis ophidion]